MTNKSLTFSPVYQDILNAIDAVDPVAYGSDRNFLDGSVSRLSPYISRGVISTKMVMERIQERDLPREKIEKFIQELAWRDYWQQLWIAHGEAINEDLKKPQQPVNHYGIPEAIAAHRTSIKAIDDCIEAFYETGYLHNHVRMYIAGISCNLGFAHWHHPAQWMYYHLLDGDWASNALSWQWVAGSNSHKKYVANQSNINKYCYSDQKGTFLDVPYSAFDQWEIPQELEKSVKLNLRSPLPTTEAINIDPNQNTLIYNYYNMDPKWHEGAPANRILLLEPAIFEKYPIGQNAINFLLSLRTNIPELQVFVGSFADLKAQAGTSAIIYKEHPLNTHYTGTEEARDWMFPVEGAYHSFFAFWKKCKKTAVYHEA